jgi:hypothetical protein
MYHGNVDEPADTNAGLIDPMIITKRSMARPNGSPTVCLPIISSTPDLLFMRKTILAQPNGWAVCYSAPVFYLPSSNKAGQHSSLPANRPNPWRAGFSQGSASNASATCPAAGEK